ncbi:lipase maturation factor family protein [Candidatus Protochlamydia phocaeensis]|uniref:lipase maturation factor family protein n=1 Tax=Candidatus Protochlamydia phocaeensis TaxID=1414722 RepID=UPI000838E0E1|nr:lipase maturation factor family protein [Candidatus Protochlamydia phocaeensis]
MLDPSSYTIISSLFPRLLGFVYFWAIGAFFFQIKGLIGSQGILPISDYLKLLKMHYGKRAYLYAPSLFWIKWSDRALVGLVVSGILVSICLMWGFYPSLCLVLLYCLYLSIVSVGQDFLSFGWEGFLLETTCYAFLISLTPVPNLMAWICINLLLFRFHVQAGAVKIQSRDVNWRNHTAIAYHYQTQPLPNTQAWYFHKLPLKFHQLSTILMFIIELIIPFGIFLTDTIRLGVFIALFGLQYAIWFTGNLSFLNYLTAILSTILLSNAVLSSFFALPPQSPPPLYLDISITIISLFFITLQLMRLWHHFYRNRQIGRWLNWFSSFHLVNPYGIFAVMTTERIEIIIEGSEDMHEWKEYLFYYKPSEITRRPRRISPYQPRLDWQAWFLPFSDFRDERWFQHLLFHLLKGTPDVLKLLRNNPFPDKPPKYVRALMYDYTFSSFKEKKEKGWWWKRTLVGAYSPIISLKQGH